jgi:hypothetical protein
MSNSTGFVGQLGGMAQNANPESIANIINHPVIDTIFFWGKVFIALAVLVFGALLFWKYYMSYNVRVKVKQRYGTGGTKVYSDRAKILTDKNTQQRRMELFKRKNKKALTTPVPESKYRQVEGKYDYFEFWLDDENNLHPILPPSAQSEEKIELNILGKDMRAWQSTETKRISEKYSKKTMMEKYQPMMIMFAAIIGAFLISFFAFKYLGGGLSDVAQSMSELAAAVTSLKG